MLVNHDYSLRKLHRNRVVLRFYGVDHISWDEINEFELDRWIGVDVFVGVIVDQFVS